MQCVAGMIVSTLARDFITDTEQSLDLRLEAVDDHSVLKMLDAPIDGYSNGKRMIKPTI